MTERVFGKWEAVVIDNDDPKGLSRIKVQVPEVTGDVTTGWALPGGGLPGDGTGLGVVPPVGSLVYVEWLGGDTSRSLVWSAGKRADGQGVPGAGPQTIVLLTPAGHKVTLDDASGSEAIAIEAASGAKVTLDGDGVTIGFGSQKVALTRSRISLNDGALEVM